MYWAEEDGEKIDGRFFREELFALNNQFKKNIYIKKYGNIYQFILNPKIIDQCSYNYPFWDTEEKKIRDGQIYSPYSQFIGKGFNFERKALK